jgi:hypothetical protein
MMYRMSPTHITVLYDLIELTPLNETDNLFNFLTNDTSESAGAKTNL